MSNQTNRRRRHESPERHQRRMEKKHARAKALKAEQADMIKRYATAMATLGVSEPAPKVRASRGSNAELSRVVAYAEAVASEKKTAAAAAAAAADAAKQAQAES